VLIKHVITKQWLRVFCGDQSLNTERPEHLRDLSVEALQAPRSQRESLWLRPTFRAKILPEPTSEGPALRPKGHEPLDSRNPLYQNAWVRAEVQVGRPFSPSVGQSSW